jgi:hypothetical protein
VEGDGIGIEDVKSEERREVNCELLTSNFFHLTKHVQSGGE